MADKKQETISYKTAEEHLAKMPWPPMVQVKEDEEPFELTELDINWVFCTMLGMKWLDACGVTDLTHRKFLYNKAMMLAEDVTRKRVELDRKREDLENKLEAKIKSIGAEVPPSEIDPLSTPRQPEEMREVLNL